MRFRALIYLLLLLIADSALVSAQARTLMTNSSRAITLPSTSGRSAVLGSVLLGRPRSFSMFNIQVTGTITPDPDLNGAGFQLQFLICDQPDCSGDLRWPMRILPDADASTGAQVIATQSFGLSTHNVEPVVLTDLRPRPANGVIFLAAVVRVMHSPGTPVFAAKLNLLRVDVLP